MARVSIIVRSMGRPELREALESLAAQTAPDLEVIVVAASGSGHAPPPPRCGRHPVRFVPGEQPRLRPVAANAGLAAASGDFIGLLDDDDLLLPGHVESLVSVLDASPACPAAYAIVREETSVFRSFRGTSGTGAGGNRDEDRYRRYRAMLAAKWERRGREVGAAIDAAAAQALDLFAQGRHDDAERAADRVLARYPHEVAALNLKGTLLALRGDLDGALARFRAAAAESPGDPASRFNLAQAFERLGRGAEALTEYDHVLALAPGHPHAAARKSALQRHRHVKAS